MGKLVVISAPSGAGKTTIVHYLLNNIKQLSFSVSACSREKRAKEIDGVDYHFLGIDGFKKNNFLEWEEVYENQFYGTLKSEVCRVWNEGKIVIFDVDVVGGMKIKEKYPNECLSIFIMPPSINALRQRLVGRGSESDKTVETRLNKASEEITKKQFFDKVILNDDLESACLEAREIINKFINL